MMKIDKPIWTKFQVRWKFLTSLCASVPANPKLLKTWLEARSPNVKPPGGRSITEIQEEVISTLSSEQLSQEEEIKKSFLVFQRDKGNLVVRAATVRAHLKDCARIISREYVGKIKGEMAFSTRFISCVYLDESDYWLTIFDDLGKPYSTPDGIREKAVHTFNGSALKSFEYVMCPQLNFILKVLGGNIHQKDIETVMTYGGVHGYGGERGDGEGKYIFSVSTIEK